MNIQAVSPKNYFNNFERIVVRNTARIVAVALDAIGSLCSFVGQNESRSYFRYKARQIRAIYVLHNYPRGSLSYPHLSSTINVAKRELITSGEDGKVSRQMRDQFIANNSGDVFAKRLENAKCLGAKITGICYGASLVFIKAYLKIAPKSEQELIEVARQFEYGFDAEAAAFNTIHFKLAPLFAKEASPDFRDTLTTYLRQKDKLDWLDADYEEKMLLLDEQSAPHFNACMDKARKNLFTLLNKINILIGLKIPVEQQKIPHICVDGVDAFDAIIRDTFDVDKLRNKFQTLPIGAYLLTLTSAHAIAYIKTDFGSYFLDPNLGLIKAGESPFTMCQGLASHYNQPINQPINELKVIPYTLV